MPEKKTRWSPINNGGGYGFNVSILNLMSYFSEAGVWSTRAGREVHASGPERQRPTGAVGGVSLYIHVFTRTLLVPFLKRRSSTLSPPFLTFKTHGSLRS